MKFNLERWGETILGAAVAVVAVGFLRSRQRKQVKTRQAAVTICAQVFSVSMASALARMCVFPA